MIAHYDLPVQHDAPAADWVRLFPYRNLQLQLAHDSDERSFTTCLNKKVSHGRTIARSRVVEIRQSTASLRMLCVYITSGKEKYF